MRTTAIAAVSTLIFGCGRTGLEAPDSINAAAPDTSVSPETATDAVADIADAPPPDAVVPVQNPCSPTGWCWTNPLPFGDGVADIHRTPSGIVWVLGHESLHKWQDGKWTTLWFPFRLNAMAGVGEKLFLVGEAILFYDGTSFRRQPAYLPSEAQWISVTARNENDACVVASARAWGLGACFDGKAWLSDPRFGGASTRIASGAPGDIWLVEYGNVFRVFGDGTEPFETKGFPSPAVDVAFDGARAWASTAEATYVRLAPNDWKKVADVGGRLAVRVVDDVFVAGPVLARIQGGVATVLRTATPNLAFSAVDAHSLDDVWVGAESGGVGTELLHGPLGALTRVTTNVVTSDLRTVFGRADDDFYAVGRDQLVHWDGTTWAALPTPKGDWCCGTFGADGAMFLASSAPPRVVRRDGAAGIDLAFEGSEVLDLWAADAKNVYVAAQDNFYRWSGSWTAVTGPDFIIGAGGVDGSGPNDVWMTDVNGILHFDGLRLERTSLPWENYGMVRARAPSDVWLTPAKARLAPPGAAAAHFDGSTWTSHPVPFDIIAIDADPGGLWALRSDATLARLASDAWTFEQLSGGLALRARSGKSQHVVGKGGAARVRLVP